MFGMLDVRYMGCLGCGMFEMWDVWDVGCSRCVMLGMRDVWDVGCLGCGMWDVDLQNANLRAVIFCVIARLFIEECSTLFVLLKIK